MTTYTITGTLAAHEHSGKPAFLHDPSTEKAVGVTNFKGEPRTVTVTTQSASVADTLESVYRRVFNSVTRTDDYDPTKCHFCGGNFLYEKGTKPEDGLYAEEVGEVWSKVLNDSVLGHVDCLPDGAIEGTNEEWSMA